MRTSEKYAEMGMTEIAKGKVTDKYGHVFFPKKARSPLRAIRLHYRECMGSDRRKQAKAENYELVKDCVDPMCPLYDFRLGKNPFLGKPMTQEQKKAVVKRLSLGRGASKNRDVENSHAH